MEKLNRAKFALLYVLAALALTIALTALINTQSFLKLYTNDFHFRPGPRFAARMIASLPVQKDACIIIGSSTAREGLDTAVIEQHLSDTHVFNAATTGGNTSVQEVQAAILAQNNTHYRCVIVQMHPWLLYDNKDAVPDLNEVQYDALMNVRTITDLSFFQWRDARNWALALDYILPFKKHAVQLDLLARNNMRDIHNAVFHDNIALARYERFEDELQPSGNSLYHDVKVPRETILKGIHDYGFDNPAIYGQSASVGSLQRAIDLLVPHAERVIIIGMPDSAYEDKPNVWAYPAFNGILKRNADKIFYIDCRKGFGADFFLDEAHLGTKGRAKLSKDFGVTLNGVLAGQKNVQSGLCRSR